MTKHELVRYVVLLMFCIYLSKMDIKERRIANKNIFAATFIGIVLALSSIDKSVIISCFLGGTAGFLVSLFIAWFSKSGIGMGDVKLLGMAGVYLGLTYLEIAVFWSLVFVILFGFIQWIQKKATRNTEYPFVPFFTAGVLVTLCVQALA